MATDVKNKIASFEAYNRQLSHSKTPPKKAPTPESNAPNDDGVSVRSSTSKASQNRRSRLQSNGPLRTAEETKRKQLAERRRQRQQRQRGSSSAGQASGGPIQQQQQQQQQPLPHHPTASSRLAYNHEPGLSSNRRFVHTISHESSTEEVGLGKSSSSEAMEGDQSRDLLSPNRRLSPARIAKAYRMQRMRHAAEGSAGPSTMQRMRNAAEGTAGPSTPQRSSPSQQPGGPTSPRTPQTHRSYEDDDTQFNSVTNNSTADDDATLTSVRQIVRGNNDEGSAATQKSQEVHRNMNNEFDDNDVAASYGYPKDTRQTWVEHGGVAARQDGVVLRLASSSDYDSDGNAKSEANSNHSKRRGSRNDSAMQAFLSQSRNTRLDDDDRTFDYGSLNEESTHASFDTQKRDAERKAKQTSQKQASVGFVPNEEASPLINQDDLEYYKKSLDSGVAKAAAGVVTAGAVGGLVLGPVGILLGVAAVGIGVGAMQIPEEQRANVKEKATNAVLKATDSISTGCATACVHSGVIDQIPPEMTKCYTATDGGDGTDGSKADQEANDNGSINASESHTPGGGENFNNAIKGLIPEGNGRKSSKPARRAACLRDVRIIPVSQIHGLAPAQQPRAWLDVMASANTTLDEKNEAMEEIQILAKDKKHARMFLDEGVLDSLMYIINNYFSQMENSFTISPAEASTAKLAATCCVTLGKAHCALVHTGGDLLLMSMYEHGKVPEDRQLAQMLYEVPYHVRVTKGEAQPGKEVFVLKSLTMTQAQELSRSLMQLAGNQ